MKAKIDILRDSSRKSFDILRNCELCPRRCRVNRVKGKTGFCRSGLKPLVQTYFSHPGEEPAISGTRGSGTIFFAHCTMHCVYCQNYEFSQLSEGKEISAEELSAMMLILQKQGCHNINLVTPTHFIPQILEALLLATEKGLNIPILYNTSGYDLAEALKLLDGIIDIYLPDMRYGDDVQAKKYSNAPDYVKINQGALREMLRQVGPSLIDEGGIVKKGLIIRHLVLPSSLSSTEKIFKFISEKLSPEVYISLMSQYHPVYKAHEFPEIGRRITKEEYEEAFKLLLKYGLSNGWVQDSTEKIDLELLGTNIKKME